MGENKKIIYVFRENDVCEEFEVDSDHLSYDVERGNTLTLSKVEKLCKIVDEYFDGDWEYYRIPLNAGSYQEVHHKFHRARN